MRTGITSPVYELECHKNKGHSKKTQLIPLEFGCVEGGMCFFRAPCHQILRFSDQ